MRKSPLAVLALAVVACLAVRISPGVALLAGIVWAFAFPNVAYGPERSRAAQKLLKLSVVALGAGMNLLTVWKVGTQGAIYTAVSISLTLALGVWLGRRMKVASDVALLVAAGTAICGGSAIAAVAGVLKPKHQDITVALTTVFVLNAIALFIFPGLGHAFGFSQRQFGLWAALAIHDTSSVVGAAMAYGHSALAVATTVKLTRALWIVPVAILAGAGMPGLGRPARAEGDGPKPQGPAKASLSASIGRLLPLFILGFIAMAALFTYVGALAPLKAPVTAVAQRLFAVTLLLIGSGFSRDALRAVGARPMVAGVILWIVVGTSTALAIGHGWIK
jgi:uncharacterized integral membrane protein (TIGR00698 family)